MNAAHSSASVEWYTPGFILDRVRMLFKPGQIDLDPASCEIAQERVQARMWFSEHENGLERQWFGNVFVNPPGGRGSAKKWWWKAVQEYNSNRVNQIVFVAFNIELLQTAQYQPLLHAFRPTQCAFCVPKTRIKYISPSGVGKQPPHSSLIVYIGGPGHGGRSGNEKFLDLFRDVGDVIMPYGDA